jgi:hypothetical protein
MPNREDPNASAAFFSSPAFICALCEICGSTPVPSAQTEFGGLCRIPDQGTSAGSREGAIGLPHLS